MKTAATQVQEFLDNPDCRNINKTSIYHMIEVITSVDLESDTKKKAADALDIMLDYLFKK